MQSQTGLRAGKALRRLPGLQHLVGRALAKLRRVRKPGLPKLTGDGTHAVHKVAVVLRFQQPMPRPTERTRARRRRRTLILDLLMLTVDVTDSVLHDPIFVRVHVAADHSRRVDRRPHGCRKRRVGVVQVALVLTGQVAHLLECSLLIRGEPSHPLTRVLMIGPVCDLFRKRKVAIHEVPIALGNIA